MRFEVVFKEQSDHPPSNIQQEWVCMTGRARFVFLGLHVVLQQFLWDFANNFQTCLLHSLHVFVRFDSKETETNSCKHSSCTTCAHVLNTLIYIVFIYFRRKCLVTTSLENVIDTTSLSQRNSGGLVSTPNKTIIYIYFRALFRRKKVRQQLHWRMSLTSPLFPNGILSD